MQLQTCLYKPICKMPCLVGTSAPWLALLQDHVSLANRRSVTDSNQLQAHLGQGEKQVASLDSGVRPSDEEDLFSPGKAALSRCNSAPTRPPRPPPSSGSQANSSVYKGGTICWTLPPSDERLPLKLDRAQSSLVSTQSELSAYLRVHSRGLRS